MAMPVCPPKASQVTVTATKNSVHDFDPATPSTYSSIVQHHCHFALVLRLQELKARNLSYTGNNLLKCLHEALNLEGEETMSTEVHHTTPGYTDTTANQNNTLWQLLSQLQQLPQQQSTKSTTSSQPDLSQHPLTTIADATLLQIRLLT